MIEISGLSVRFEGCEAVRDVSFTARSGEITGYLGPNGAGKSTTLKVLAGLIKVWEGSVSVCGLPLGAHSFEAKRLIGYVPEEAALYESLTPHEYLSLVSELYGIDREKAAERIHELLTAFCVDVVADRPIEVLSKGARQKVLIAGALVHDPSVLLLDEPLSGLDVSAVLAFRRIMEDLRKRGATILFCSHILDAVERICSRVVVIHKGRIVAESQTTALMEQHTAASLTDVFQVLTQEAERETWAGDISRAMETQRLTEAPDEGHDRK